MLLLFQNGREFIKDKKIGDKKKNKNKNGDIILNETNFKDKHFTFVVQVFD
jgi:hypothetical protein